MLGGTGSRREGCGGGAGRRSGGPGAPPQVSKAGAVAARPPPRGEALITVGLRGRQGSTGALPAAGHFRREGTGNKRGGGAGTRLIYARTSACVFAALSEKKAAAGEEGAPRDLPGGGAAAATARGRVRILHARPTHSPEPRPAPGRPAPQSECRGPETSPQAPGALAERRPTGGGTGGARQPQLGKQIQGALPRCPGPSRNGPSSYYSNYGIVNFPLKKLRQETEKPRRHLFGFILPSQLE